MRTIRTPEMRAAFLEALANSGNVTLAALRAGVGREALYQWRAHDPAFAAAWEDALTLGLAWLEDRAVELATAGSEKILIFLLSSRIPERYSVKATLEVNANINVNLSRQPLDQLRAELATLVGTAPPLTIEADDDETVIPFPPTS